MKNIGWAFGAFFGISAFGLFVGGNITAGLICSVGALLAIPPVWAYSDRERGKRKMGAPIERKYLLVGALVLYLMAIFMQSSEGELIDKPKAEVASTTQKGLGIDSGELSTYFNMFVQENQLPKSMELPYEFEIKEYEYNDTFTHAISRRVALSALINKESKKLQDITITFQPDGSEAAISDTILVFSGVLHSIDESISNNDMKEIIFPALEELTTEGSSKSSYRDIRIQGSFIDGMGFFINFTKV